ncbi:hypothetical protein BDZ91DRAFT_725064 [Kalaharituber pfeilii]|nr:hypothetical protein BDZ91DRAFT_725064 [Kalaharituber pfeilii]
MLVAFQQKKKKRVIPSGSLLAAAAPQRRFFLATSLGSATVFAFAAARRTFITLEKRWWWSAAIPLLRPPSSYYYLRSPSGQQAVSSLTRPSLQHRRTMSTDSVSRTYPKIAIIGAGPTGLTLANLLARQNIPFTIYEREKSARERSQGGTLDLHPSSGQLALRSAGLFAEFRKFARPEGDALKVVEPDGTVIWDEGDHGVEGPETPPRSPTLEESDRPEIDRVLLREILLDGLKHVPEGSQVKWGKKTDGIRPDPKYPEDEGKWEVVFTDGETVGGWDLVVGADGCKSRVRPWLTPVEPYYSGISMVELWALDVDERNPWLSSYVGMGSCFMFDKDRAILCQRNGNGSVRVYVSLRVPENWSETCGVDFRAGEKARRDLVDAWFSDCGADLKRVVIEAGDELVLRKLYMLPVGLTWEAKNGVTVIGDAAHLMTVFAGEGVNVGMGDALELSEWIAKWVAGQVDRDRAVRAYETAMFERAEEKARDTWEQLELLFGDGGGRKMVEMMKGRGAPDRSVPGAAAAVDGAQEEKEEGDSEAVPDGASTGGTEDGGGNVNRGMQTP